ncbi:hypothetical protein HPY24_09915, partial [Methylobacterium sp. IIF1SW-B5]|nr:hypothetical protein [Methylobacterium ajmalii]
PGPRAVGATIFAGRDRAGEARFVEFRRAGALSATARRDLDRTLDVTRQERARAEFRRTLAAAAKGQGQGDAGRLRYASRAVGFAEVVSDAGFLPVRVVAPSPFR